MFAEFKTPRRMAFAGLVFALLLAVLGIVLLGLSSFLSGFEGGTRRALVWVVDFPLSWQLALVLCRYLFGRGWLAPNEREEAAIGRAEAPRPAGPPPSTTQKVIWIGGIWTVAIFMILAQFILSKQWNFYIGVTVLTAMGCLYIVFRVMRWRRESRKAR